LLYVTADALRPRTESDNRVAAQDQLLLTYNLSQAPPAAVTEAAVATAPVHRTQTGTDGHLQYIGSFFSDKLIMAALRSRCGHYIFIMWFLLSILLLFFLA